MDPLYDNGVHFILGLQASFRRWENEMLFLSRVGDPRNSFLIYFPLVFHFDDFLGLTVLWTAIISEWLNLVLKWILQGERPYWWIHETVKWENVTLKQYELTCETGPGSPSGHAMVTSAVLCLLAPAIINLIKGKLLIKAPNICKMFGSLIVWILLLSVIFLVCISRVFIATHFPHQVLLGALLGALTSLIVQKCKSKQICISHSVLYAFLISVILGTISLLSYKILLAFVYDPSVSVKKAQKWCISLSFVHQNTTPFYALVRDTGATLGIGIAVFFIKLTFRINSYLPDIYKLKPCSSWFFPSWFTKSLISVTVLQLLECIALPNFNPLLFYVCGYVKFSLVPIVVAFLVPAAICKLHKVFIKSPNMEHFD